jgi:uncharacterized protein YbjT (DUF2867 family)
MAIVLVTGTSSGIGLATAVSLARRGHKVIATMRNPQGATELQNMNSLARVPAKHDGTVHRLAQFHPSARKNPLQSSARAVRCAKLCHRLTQCTGHKQFVFPQIFSSFPQNSTTERQPSQSGRARGICPRALFE